MRTLARPMLQNQLVQTNEVFRDLPFPYADNVFPRTLGAVVMRTVLDGTEPARIVTHWADGDWSVEDGVNVPTPENAVVAHIWDVVRRNSSVARLATMSPGQEAQREDPGGEWSIRAHIEPED